MENPLQGHIAAELFLSIIAGIQRVCWQSTKATAKAATAPKKPGFCIHNLTGRTVWEWIGHHASRAAIPHGYTFSYLPLCWKSPKVKSSDQNVQPKRLMCCVPKKASCIEPSHPHCFLSSAMPSIQQSSTYITVHGLHWDWDSTSQCIFMFWCKQSCKAWSGQIPLQRLFQTCLIDGKFDIVRRVMPH